MAATPDNKKRRDLRQRLRETAGVLHNARRTIGLVASVDRPLLALLCLCQISEALCTVGLAWVGKYIIDAIVVATAAAKAAPLVLDLATLRSGPVSRALGFVGLELGLLVLRSITTQLASYAQVSLRSRLSLLVNMLILDKAAAVSYPYFEDPEFNNRLLQARREASMRPLSLVNQLLSLLRHSITLAGFSALLLSLGPVAVLILLVTAIPPFLSETYHGRAAFQMQRARSLRNRKLFYLEAVLTGEQTVKEVKLFSLARWLGGLYRQIHEAFHLEEVTLARRQARWGFLVGLLATLARYAMYAQIVLWTIAGRLTLGSMTLYLLVFQQGQTTLQAALSAVARVYEDNLFMTNLFEYLAVPGDEPEEDFPKEETASGAPTVTFKNVTFRYPGAQRDALTEINLTLAPGETVALVGKNGAGKTTLVKLLTGLYRPQSGQVLIDGVDVASLSAAALRRRVGVIFQDFARFSLSAADNVGVGWLPAREDRTAIDRAVHDAGAEDVMKRLPQGLDTALGRAFGGDDLSVGQWQRVALARAFMRRSQILILDEPTAAMDAEAEHEIFQRFRDLKRGRTALLITHRFATVRMADRIVVFEGGRIVEEGSHQELMAAGGRYATLFRLQAEGYDLDE